jgi:hypothetical protein
MRASRVFLEAISGEAVRSLGRAMRVADYAGWGPAILAMDSRLVAVASGATRPRWLLLLHGLPPLGPTLPALAAVELAVFRS